MPPADTGGVPGAGGFLPAEQCAVADIENKTMFINITHTLDTITYVPLYGTGD